MVKSFAIEQRGKGEGGKKPPSRMIKQVFKVFENRTAGRKHFFDTLKRLPMFRQALICYSDKDSRFSSMLQASK